MHTLQGGVSRLRIAVVLAAFTAISAFAETPISDPVTGRGASWQSAPVSATDGRDFLLVWIDGRSGRAAIYATRVAANGSVLDPDAILVSDVADFVYPPSVAWTGSSYIVVWQQDGCRFRRIAADGRIDNTAGRVLDGGCLGSRVAGRDGMAIVAAPRSYGNIEVEAIESTGAVRKLDPANGGQFDVACTRSECRLVWESYGLVSGRRLGRNGQRLSEDRILATEAMSPVLAATEERFLLAWRDRTVPGSRSRRIWAQELDAQADFEPFVVAETTEPVLLDVRLSPSGRGFLAAWKQGREAPIEPPGSVRTDDVAYPLPPLQAEMRVRRVGDGEDQPVTIARSNVALNGPPAVASNGVTHIGAWIERNSYKVAAAILDDGVRSRIAVTRTAAAQSEPHVVDCGNHQLVVWAEERNGKYSILARRFQLSGEPLDPRPIAIASASAIESQHRPVAAFDGRSYLVAWFEGSRVYARRLHRDGTPAAEVLALSENVTGRPPAVAATDRGFAVLHGHGPQLMLTRIGADSSLERTVIAESAAAIYALGWSGTELVAVWSGYNNRVQAARRSSDGARLGPDILVGFGNHPTMSLSVACGTSECVAAWSSLLEGVKTASIANGQAFQVFETIPDPPYYRVQSTDRYHPTVVRTAGAFKVLSYGPNGTLYMQSVRDGATSAESPVSEPRIEAEDYAIAATGDGLVTVYSRSVAGPGYGGSRRLFLRGQAQ